MDYSKLLESVKNASKDRLKELSILVDEDHIKQIKDMKLDKEIEHKLIMMTKDRSFLTMLLVNSLK